MKCNKQLAMMVTLALSLLGVQAQAKGQPVADIPLCQSIDDDSYLSISGLDSTTEPIQVVVAKEDGPTQVYMGKLLAKTSEHLFKAAYALYLPLRANDGKEFSASLKLAKVLDFSKCKRVECKTGYKFMATLLTQEKETVFTCNLPSF